MNDKQSWKFDEADLADGTFLKYMITRFHQERTKENLLRILLVLRDSTVWVPCEVVLGEADQARIEALVQQAGDDLEALKGTELTTQEETRLVPDILRCGESFFFPVFSDEGEMGEYGKHFSHIPCPMLQAVGLARSNDRKVSGIVVNAFTENFVLDAGLFDYLEQMESHLPE